VLPFGSALDVAGYVAANDADIVIVFRGTTNLIDWLQNIKFNQLPWIDGQVHAGFLEDFRSVESQVSHHVQSLDTAQQRLWIAGHSLGGALATLAEKRLSFTYKIEGAYTYGQPRVGDPVFAKHFQPALYRFVNQGDWITDLPPCWALFWFYQHVGVLEFLNKKSLTENPFPDQPRYTTPDVIAMTDVQRQEFIYRVLAAHDIATYIQNIQKLLPKRTRRPARK
jgi:predicted lipase